MNKHRFNFSSSYLGTVAYLALLGSPLFISSFASLYDPTKDGEPEIKVYTREGEVNLDEGISANTDKIFLRMIPEKGDELAYKVTKVIVTLVSGGKGLETIRANDMIEVSKILSKVKEKSILVLEVQEYMIKGKEDQVETISMTYFIKVPIK